MAVRAAVERTAVIVVVVLEERRVLVAQSPAWDKSCLRYQGVHSCLDDERIGTLRYALMSSAGRMDSTMPGSRRSDGDNDLDLGGKSEHGWRMVF